MENLVLKDLLSIPDIANFKSSPFTFRLIKPFINILGTEFEIRTFCFKDNDNTTFCNCINSHNLPFKKFKKDKTPLLPELYYFHFRNKSTFIYICLQKI